MSVTLTQVASDNFNRADGTIAGSNNWVASDDGVMAHVIHSRSTVQK